MPWFGGVSGFVVVWVFFFLFVLFEMEFPYIIQASLELAMGPSLI